MSTSLSIRLSLCLSISLSVYLSIYVPIYYICIYLSIYCLPIVSIYYLCWSIIYLFMSLLIYYLSIIVSIYCLPRVFYYCSNKFTDVMVPRKTNTLFFKLWVLLNLFQKYRSFTLIIIENARLSFVLHLKRNEDFILSIYVPCLF